MTPPRPRIIDCDTLIFPVEAAELIGIPYQRLIKLWIAGKVPAPVDGQYRLGAIVRDYIAYVERSTREETQAHVARNFLAGL